MTQLFSSATSSATSSVTSAAMRTKPETIRPPQQVRLRRAQKLIELVWADGELSQVSCLMLRKSCACSACARGQQTGALTLIDAEVGVDRLEMSGVSGLQFYFSDGHYRGLYPWAYLRELSEAA